MVVKEQFENTMPIQHHFDAIASYCRHKWFDLTLGHDCRAEFFQLHHGIDLVVRKHSSLKTITDLQRASDGLKDEISKLSGGENTERSDGTNNALAATANSNENQSHDFNKIRRATFQHTELKCDFSFVFQEHDAKPASLWCYCFLLQQVWPKTWSVDRHWWLWWRCPRGLRKKLDARERQMKRLQQTSSRPMQNLDHLIAPFVGKIRKSVDVSKAFLLQGE